MGLVPVRARPLPSTIPSSLPPAALPLPYFPFPSSSRPLYPPIPKTSQNPRSPPAAAAACNCMMSRHPEVKWAQRIDKVYITVQLPDAKDAKVNLEPDGVFTFSATAGTDRNLYESKLDLNDKVNVEASKISVGVRSIFCIVEKAEAKWWKKLVRDDQKAPHFVKVDWDKWVDEDDDGADVNLDGMDFSNFGGMGGMGGMGDMAGLGGMGGMGGMGDMAGLGGMGGLGGMEMDDLEDESDDEEEVSKHQDAEKADEAGKTQEAEAKPETAKSN